MKIAKYILGILLVLGYSGQLFARDPEVIGAMDSPEGRLVCFELESGQEVQQVAAYAYSMENGSKEQREVTFFRHGDYCFITLPVNQTANHYAYEFMLTFADGTSYTTPKYEEENGRWFSWLGTDLKWTEAVCGVSGKSPLIDACYGYEDYPGAAVPVNRASVFKALVTYATGHFQYDFPEDTEYDLLKTDYGVANFDMTDFSLNGRVRFELYENDQKTQEHEMYAPGFTGNTPGPHIRTYEVAIQGKTSIKLAGAALADKGNIMVYAMPRAYLKADKRTAQQITWKTEVSLDESRPFVYTLSAKASSGLPVSYRLVAGSEYADLEGNKLDIHTLPENEYIEVEAFQPGDASYAPSDVYRCRFTITGKKIVAKDEAYVLQAHEAIDEIIVKGDKESVGQLSVADGKSAQVGKLVLEYTFVPGEWNFISFPSNADLSKITNLQELGYAYNQGEKAFYVLEYNTKLRADKPDQSAWKRLSTPSVLANKGYIMGVSRSADNPDDHPVVVTFTFDNLTLDLNKEQDGRIGVTMDFYEVQPGTKVPVYISPAQGVKGNTLKFDMEFQPKNLEDLPMNYQVELEQSRITFNPNRSGIRITLPTSEKAKVLIFDSRARLVKAVRYESPFLIDVRDLKSGTYQVLIQYGGAKEYKELVIE